MKKSQVVVIGGDPAGSSAAYFLAKRRINVNLIDKDKWPRDKVCGGGVIANYFPVLQKMGLMEELDKIADFKYTGYVIYSQEGAKIQAPVRQRIGKGSEEIPYSYIIDRKVFDKMLLDKAREAGANIFTETEAKEVDISQDIIVETKQEENFVCDVLVVADGSGSSITRKFQQDVHKGSAIAIKSVFTGVKNLEEKMEFFLDDDVGFGYGWIFPMGRGRANVGIGLDIAYLKQRNKNIRQLFAEMLERPLIKPRLEGAKMVSKPQSFPLRMGFDLASFRKGRVLFAGDAARLVYPLNGEGISCALKSGEVAASVIADAFKEPVDFRRLTRYEKKCAKVFSDFKAATRMQKLMGSPRIQRFVYNNSVYDDKLGQRAMGILEHSSDVKTFFNIRSIVQGFYTAFKRRMSKNGKK